MSIITSKDKNWKHICKVIKDAVLRDYGKFYYKIVNATQIENIFSIKKLSH